MTILSSMPVKQTSSKTDLEIELEYDDVETLLNSCIQHINHYEGNVFRLWFNRKLRRLMVKSE